MRAATVRYAMLSSLRFLLSCDTVRVICEGLHNTSRQVTSEGQLEGHYVTQQVSCVTFNLSDIPPTETTHRAELNLYVGDDDLSGLVANCNKLS